ncbi:MAG: 2-oxo acid dehydrogenase subunit E2 [Phycisphaerales bacterium]|nr:MAG: 2-oxo acid dehydrogenase subunit E2 [Phycisphaerales bacterium]
MAGKVSSDPSIFLLPDIGEGLTEAELVKWLVKPGDTVEATDALAEVETDKALSEVTSPRDGVIKAVHGDPGEMIKVGAVFVEFEGGASSAASGADDDDDHEDAHAEGEREDAGTVVGQMSGEMPGMSKDGKALATPAVRRFARDLGVDLDRVQGTGIGGRITKRDVETFANSGGSAGAKTKPAASAPSKPATGSTPPSESRRPLPGAAPHRPQFQPQQHQPAYQPQAMPQQMPQPMPHGGYGAPMMPQYAPAYPAMPPMVMVPTPYGYMPMPMPGMPNMPGYGGPQQSGGLPYAPGYAGPAAPRPIPAPAQQTDLHGQPTAKTPFRGVRRTIAQRLRASVDTAVHFTVVDEADVTALDALRMQMTEATGVKLSFLPFISAAVCRALSARLGGRFGALNAIVDDENAEIVQHAAVHLGIATDTDSGLMVPVIPDADQLGPVELAGAIADTAKAARDRSIPRERLSGSTFTISNVGSHAGRFATPVINYPEVAILAVGKVYDGVVVQNGQPAVGKVMPLSLACDHRVVDGATAALCLAEIVQSLQDAAF